MPIEFTNCVKRGGKVRTKKLSGGRIQKVCFKGGRTYAGHVEKLKLKTTKSKKK